jgi:hypothetical protein
MIISIEQFKEGKNMKRPSQEEYKPYFEKYIGLVPEGDILKILKKQIKEFEKVCKSISPKKSLYRYAPGKWTIREVIGHIVDTERVMAYRALSIARNGQNNLPGFDQDEFARRSNYNDVKLQNIIDEFCAVRTSSIFLFNALSEEASKRSGIANNYLVSVRALAYIMAGHLIHHLNVIKEKYLK